MSEQARRWVIHGRVQGVSFRWFTCREARALGLRGWVRNRVDGAVEAEVAGPEEKLEELRSRLARGPRWAQVDRVDQESLDAGDVIGGTFEIRQ